MRYATAAAEQALEFAASEDAVRLARRALETADLGRVGGVERTALLLLLGRALHAAGSTAEALGLVAEAFDRAEAAGDIELACSAALEYGGPSGKWQAYGDERGPAQLRRVLELLPDGDTERRGGGARVARRVAHHRAW